MKEEEHANIRFQNINHMNQRKFVIFLIEFGNQLTVNVWKEGMVFTDEHHLTTKSHSVSNPDGLFKYYQ